MSRKFVYIAGPISTGDQFENVRQGMVVFNRLHGLGYHPVSPHWSVLQHLHHPLEWGEWVDYGVETLERCDAVLRLPGRSPGADVEEAAAVVRGIPVFFSVDSLLEGMPP